MTSLEAWLVMRVAWMVGVGVVVVVEAMGTATATCRIR